MLNVVSVCGSGRREPRVRTRHDTHRTMVVSGTVPTRRASGGVGQPGAWCGCRGGGGAGGNPAGKVLPKWGLGSSDVRAARLAGSPRTCTTRPSDRARPPPPHYPQPPPVLSVGSVDGWMAATLSLHSGPRSGGATAAAVAVRNARRFTSPTTRQSLGRRCAWAVPWPL